MSIAVLAFLTLSGCANRGYTLSEQIPLYNEKLELRKDLVKINETTYVKDQLLDPSNNKENPLMRAPASTTLSTRQLEENYSKVPNTIMPSESALLIYF